MNEWMYKYVVKRSREKKMNCMQNMKTDKKIIKKDTKIRENFKRDIIGQVLLD